MAKEICISSTPHETRLAILEDDQLAEIYYERENEYTLAGSIYKGRVTRVLPGMQSAFVDLGLERDAFLYVTDFLEEQEEDSAEFERVDANGNGRRQPREQREPREQPSRSRAAEGETEMQASAEAPLRHSEQEPREDRGESGVRRWHGRRGRRFRGRGNEQRPLESPEVVEEAIEAEPVALPEHGAPGGVAMQHPAREHHPAAQPPALVLPGESISKYGGRGEARPAVAEPTPRAAAPAPAVQPTSRPSTLVEVPTGWDGGLVLPGETLSRHRRGRSEAHHGESSAPAAQETQAAVEVPQQIEPAENFEPATEPGEEPKLHGEELPPAEYGEAQLEAAAEAAAVSEADGLAETAAAEAPVAPQPPTENLQPTEAALTATPHTRETAAPSPAPELDEVAEEVQEYEPQEGSASHRVDPVRGEFRFSAPVEEEEEFQGEVARPQQAPAEQQNDPAMEPIALEHELHEHEPGEHELHEHELHEHAEAAAQNSAVSAEAEVVRQLFGYAPGMGVLEEETIDEEEYDFEPILGEHEDHVNEEMEEETIDHAATVGETVRDIHIDKRLGYDNPAEAAEEEETADFDIGFAETRDSEAEEEEGVEEEGVEEDFEEGEEESGAQTATSSEAPARREDRRGRRGGRGRQQQGGGHRRHGRRPNMQTLDVPVISELLKQGQEILVQIAKEPIARKGARITSHIALPGRFLVFMPTVNHVGVSRKIASDEERQRLKRILISEKGTAAGGFIVRTAAENAGEEDLRADIRFLINLWAEIKQRSDNAKAPALIYHDLNLVERILRDQVSDNFATIWVDNETEYERIVRFLNRFQPSLVRRVKLYTKETPLFEQFGIQEEISKALKSKVWLKSGGSIVINQTEALVAIDINTGKYVGKTARLEDTILKTNLDAIPEIVRQIRLRDLGGIIVIDFIDMDERRNRQKVTQALEDALKADRAPSKVLQFNDFGLVAITRKRVKQSLERTLSVPCPICTGTGMVKSPITVANEVYIEMRKMMRHLERNDVLLRVHPEVVKVLKANNAKWLNELEEMIGKTIIVKSDPTLPPEQFDIQG
jgi:ribonuclease E